MIVIETIKEFIAKVKGFFVKHGDINKDGVLSKEDLVALKDKTKDELYQQAQKQKLKIKNLTNKEICYTLN